MTPPRKRLRPPPPDKVVKKDEPADYTGSDPVPDRVLVINLRFFNRVENSKEGLNLTLDTLEKLADGLGSTVSEIVRTQKVQIDRSVEGVEKAIKMLQRVKKDLSS